MNDKAIYILIICGIIILIIIVNLLFQLSDRNKQNRQLQSNLNRHKHLINELIDPLMLVQSAINEKRAEDANKLINKLIAIVNQVVNPSKCEMSETENITVDIDNSVNGIGDEKANKILIVENDVDMASFLQNKLAADYYVYCVHDADSGWNLLNNKKIDLVVSEIDLPGTGGDKLCALIKNNLLTSHIPVVLVGVNNPNLLKGFAIGADNYLPKPFDSTVLKAMVSTILANRNILRQRFSNFETLEENDNGLSPIDEKFINTVNEYIKTNMSDPLFNIDSVCSHVGMSRSSFYNKIKALTDKSPATYVRDYRLNQAAILLKDGRYNITEVADLTGFNDAKYFREVFKKRYDMTPSAYINK